MLSFRSYYRRAPARTRFLSRPALYPASFRWSEIFGFARVVFDASVEVCVCCTTWTYLLTYLLTPWCRISSEKLIVTQLLSPGPRRFEIFPNMIAFYSDGLLVPRPTPKLEYHHLSAVRNCLFNIFAATLCIWRPSPPSANWGRTMPQWQRTHLTWTMCTIRSK
jgi:hypothetical protein